MWYNVLVKKKLPKHLNILGYKIPVKLTSLDESHGEYTTEPRMIKINDEPTHDWGSTLFHEACHTSLEISGLREILGSDKEEAIVRCIENAIWPLIEQGIFDSVKEIDDGR